jgi:hypothetical protein
MKCPSLSQRNALYRAQVIDFRTIVALSVAVLSSLNMLILQRLHFCDDVYSIYYVRELHWRSWYNGLLPGIFIRLDRSLDLFIQTLANPFGIIYQYTLHYSHALLHQPDVYIHAHVRARQWPALSRHDGAVYPPDTRAHIEEGLITENASDAGHFLEMLQDMIDLTCATGNSVNLPGETARMGEYAEKCRVLIVNGPEHIAK